jgi:hypothetical protein
LNLTITPPGQQKMTFKPVVLAATREKELRWRGAILAGWLFAGEHYFSLEETGPNLTSLTHGEIFSGLLEPLLIRGAIAKALQNRFIAMDEALKQRAESRREQV